MKSSKHSVKILLGAFGIASSVLSHAAQCSPPKVDETIGWPSANETAVPHTEYVSARDIASLREIGPPTVSPDGLMVAFALIEPDLDADIWRVGWFVASVRGTGPIVYLGKGGDPERFRFDRLLLDGRNPQVRETLSAKWAPDGRWVAYVMRHDGQEQVWRSSVDGEKQEQITFAAGDVVDFKWNGDGTAVLYSTRWRREEFEQRLRHGKRNGFRISADSYWRYAVSMPVIDMERYGWAETQIWRQTIGSNSAERATEEEAVGFDKRTGMAGKWPILSPDGEWELRLREGEGDSSVKQERGILALRRNRKTVAELSGPTIDKSVKLGPSGILEAAFWHPDSKQVFCVRATGTNKPGRSLVRWDLENGEFHSILETNDRIDFAQSAGERIVWVHRSPLTPERIECLEPRTGERHVVAEPNPEWQRFRLGEASWVGLRDQAGNESFGLLVAPVDYEISKRYPLVVTAYRTDNAVRAEAGFRFPTHLLSREGFFVLVYHHWWNDWIDRNRRLDKDRPLDQLWQEMYSNDVEVARVPFQQLQALVERLDREGRVDRKKVGIGGHSLGMNIAAYGLLNSELFTAASLGWIRWNPSEYYTVMPDTARRMAMNAGLMAGSEADSGHAQQALSLSLNVKRVFAPILLQCTDDELGRNAQMDAIVRFHDASKPLETFVFSDELHGMSHPSHRLAQYARNTQWFQYWLQCKRVDDPIDPDQYVRWDKLRELHEADLKKPRPPRLKWTATPMEEP